MELRNQNLECLSGVEGFDIGPKLGFERVDNGACFFKSYEVPLDSMLSKYIQVKPNGEVLGLENKEAALKYGYGSMLNLRVILTYNFAFTHMIYPSMCNAFVYK